MSPRIFQLVLSLSLVAVLLGGCNSDDGQGSTGCFPIPDITTPDKLMRNFETIYYDMMIDEFEEMLHPAYRTILLQATMDEWSSSDDPLAESYFSRDDEIRIHRNIFSGNTGLSAFGDTIPPVAEIRVDLLDKGDSTWEPIEDSDPDFSGHGGYWATYQVLLYFVKPDNRQFEIDQVVEFYVAPIDDGGKEKWLLLGIRGQEKAMLGTEETTLCMLKTLYR